MTLQFWQGWPRGNRIFFLVFLVLFGVSIATMWVGFLVGPAPTIELQTISEAEVDEIPVDKFSKGPFDFTVKANNYVILQRQLGSMLASSEAVAYVYLVMLAVFVIGMLSVISTLGKFYYLAGMGVFILFITTLSPEVLGVFGMYGKTFAIVVMASYGMASFWLFYFSTTASFATRILVFTSITILLWVVIYFMSATEKPFLFIATYSTKAGLIACGLFIVTVAHEIVAAFVFAVTQNPKQRKSLNHFLVISLIYFVNLVLAYSVRFGFIRWNLITIDLFLLLTISAILGIWGIRQRHKTYEGVIDADPHAVFAFLLMGGFTFATIAMLMFNANDTALSAIEDIIIFAHLGFGAIFFTYIFSNFGNMLSQNLQVYKVLYSPNNMPYFTFRLAGLITLIALAIYNAWQVPVHNAVSGYYNGLGDLYMKLNNERIAKLYYDESRTYGFRGHHANYALANIEGGVYNASDENRFYGEASGRRPTQMSFLNWAQTYQSANDNLQAILTLTTGASKLTDHDAIDNTLGLLYARTGLADSASKYLSKSMASSSFSKISSSNMVGLAALDLLPAPDDSARVISEEPVMRVNQLGLLNSMNKSANIQFQLPADTILTLAQAATISNYLINTRYNADTTFVRKVIALARKPSNEGFKEALLSASSTALYNSGETKDAFMTLEEVTVASEHKGRYNTVLTMWSLENDEPQRAFGYVDYAVSQNYPQAKLTHAVALTESGRIKEALISWDSVRVMADTTTIELATTMRHALEVPSAMTITLNNEELYAYARYRLSVADSNQVFLLINQITNDDLKAKTLLDLAQKCLAIDKPAAALKNLQRIVGLGLTDASTGKQMQILEMLARVRMGATSTVLDALKQNPVAFDGKEKKYRVYFDALAAEAAGDTARAIVYYRWLGTANPYFEDGLIAAATFFKKKGQTSYNMLVEGLLHHPSSIRIRKAYALESARQGLADYAKSELMELKVMINSRDYEELSRQVNELLAVER